MKTGGSVIFKHEESPSGMAFGELRVCPCCERKSFINGVQIVRGSYDAPIIKEHLEEYSPEVNEEGTTVCQFCGEEEE